MIKMCSVVLVGLMACSLNGSTIDPLPDIGQEYDCYIDGKKSRMCFGSDSDAQSWVDTQAEMCGGCRVDCWPEPDLCLPGSNR